MRTMMLMALMLLTACNATTRLSGYVDPAYRYNFQAKKIVVTSIGIPLEEKKNVEDTFIASLEGYDVEVIRGLDVYPPTRDLSEADLFSKARKKGADSILILSAHNREVHKDYVPPTYHPGTTTSYANTHGSLYGNTYSGYTTVNTYTTPGYTTGGYDISKPAMGVQVTLHDAKKRKTIWTAEGRSGGNAFAGFADLSMSAARTSVTELSSAGLIAEKIEAPENKEAPKE